MVSVGGQAADGMQLGRDNGTMATTAAGLEGWPAMRQRVISNLVSYNELRHAPVVDADDYHGPVLFSGDAAADVVNRLFVPNVEADRPEMGTTARTQGAYQSSLHSPILPSYVSVVDDPTERTFEGQSLLGAYSVDDEGTTVAPVTLVKGGELVNYVIGRQPVKDFPASNGHGRAIPAQAAHSRTGVVIVKSTQNLTTEQMRAKLVALAKEKNKSVFEVETLGGGELMPRLLYRISPDGKRTLVRGAAFDDLDQRALRADIVAVGGKPWVAQTIAPIPQTTIVPSILFDDITVKRANQEQQKLPYYPPPALAAN
jgi:predicted Zn-dependent protease